MSGCSTRLGSSRAACCSPVNKKSKWKSGSNFTRLADVAGVEVERCRGSGRGSVQLHSGVVLGSSRAACFSPTETDSHLRCSHQANQTTRLYCTGLGVISAETLVSRLVSWHDGGCTV